MKRFILFYLFIHVFIFSFSQEINSNGRYVVKTISFNTYNNDNDEKFVLNFSYDENFNLIEIKKSYVEKGSIIEEIYSKNEDKKINICHYKNGKINSNIVHFYELNDNNFVVKETYKEQKEKLNEETEFYYDSYFRLNKMVSILTESKDYYYFSHEFDLIWEGNNINASKLILNGDRKFPLTTNYVYNDDENNTNINFNYLVGTVSKKYIEYKPVLFTEWSGVYSKNIVNSTDLGYKRKTSSNRVLIENGLITKIFVYNNSFYKNGPYASYTITYL